MNFNPGHVYHIYNRGNNKQKIFFSEGNYWFFVNKIEKQIKPICDILCWCLMPNHFHLVLHANESSCQFRKGFGRTEIQELSLQIGKMTSSYAQAINKQNGTLGSLFQQKTKSKMVTDPHLLGNNHYLLNVIHYCHQNPWKAGLVKKIEDWPYSSFSDYCGFRNNDLCNQNLLFELTGYSRETFYNDSYGVIDGFEF